ncbi:unnamed protein product [Victoria cruziana]
MELQCGVLEVLLVDAEGLKIPRFLGKRHLHVVIEYGDQEMKSKAVEAKGKAARWNEKFKFKITGSDKGRVQKLVLKIMDADNFAVGKTRIHVGGMKGSLEVEKAPVVLEDGSYNGEIRVGLQFTAGASWTACDSNDIRTLDPSNKVDNAKADTRSSRMLETLPRFSLKALLDFWDMTWRKFSSYKEGNFYMLTDASGASRREAVD